MKSIPLKRIEEFQMKIFSWWEENKRTLPWRETTNPYYILVSEVMLQQTQVSRVIEKYNNFIFKFPTIERLGSAQIAEVLKEWSGLGYNRRALWLQEAAKGIIKLESFPRTPEQLKKLKGIGEYTSKSILIFAFNEDYSAVDTNIRRVLIKEGFANEKTSMKELLEIANQLLPKGRARDWHNALMDFGALFLTSNFTGIKPLTKQPKFNKSNRYFRGKIIKLLTHNKEMTLKELSADLQLSDEEVNILLDSLLTDQLIIKKKERISLP